MLAGIRCPVSPQQVRERQGVDSRVYGARAALCSDSLGKCAERDPTMAGQSRERAPSYKSKVIVISYKL